jgi:hypothetical protein
MTGLTDPSEHPFEMVAVVFRCGYRQHLKAQQPRSRARGLARTDEVDNLSKQSVSVKSNKRRPCRNLLKARKRLFH